MKTVLLRAPTLSRSGYGVHARQIARWLFRKAAVEHSLDITAELLRWGNTHWLTDLDDEDGLVRELIAASNNVKPFYDVSIQLQLPNEWNPYAAAFNVGITAGVETDKCNPAWVTCVNQMSLVIVPSEFTRQTFLNSGEVTTPIVVVPEAFPDCYLEEQLPEVDLNLETKFNFLIVGQVTGNNVHNDRKNIPLTIKWIMDEFAGDRDVGLVVKTNWTGCSTKLDKVITTNMFNKMLEDLGLSKQTFPRIYLLHGTMRDNEVASLYRNQDIKALVSLTRGEGFGLPLLEAAASGLPVIATNWSAHTEFLSLGKYISVNHDLVPVHETKLDNQIFMPGAKWAYPSELDAKFRLRKFYESSQMPKVWAADLKSKIQSNYSFEAIAKRYDQVLGSVLKEE